MTDRDANQEALDAPNDRRPDQRYRGGALLVATAIAYVVLVAGIIVPVAVAGEAPYFSDVQLVDFYTHHPGPARLLAFLVLASAVPLAVFTAIASHRICNAGLDGPGWLIALVGGTVAAVMLALSGLSSLALTRPHVAENPAVIRALQALAFATGGPGFMVFTGLLVAGISVPALVGRFTPRWVGWFGVVLAGMCELAILTAAFDALSPLLPIDRLTTMAWLITIAVTLSARSPGLPG